MHLQPVNMRFDYGEAFEASRGTGYEVMLYNCMIGDATLFSRTDLVETAWRIAQPILDAWAQTPPTDFPNYPAGSWGPKAAFDLIERDGRQLGGGRSTATCSSRCRCSRGPTRSSCTTWP